MKGSLGEELLKSIVEARRKTIEQLKQLSKGLDITLNNEFIIPRSWNDELKIVGIDEGLFVLQDDNEEYDFVNFDDDKISTEMLLSILIDLEAGKYRETEHDDE